MCVLNASVTPLLVTWSGSVWADDRDFCSEWEPTIRTLCDCTETETNARRGHCAVLYLLVSSNFVTRVTKVLVATQPVENFPACCGIQRLIYHAYRNASLDPVLIDMSLATSPYLICVQVHFHIILPYTPRVSVHVNIFYTVRHLGSNCGCDRTAPDLIRGYFTGLSVGFYCLLFGLVCWPAIRWWEFGLLLWGSCVIPVSWEIYTWRNCLALSLWYWLSVFSINVSMRVECVFLLIFLTQHTLFSPYHSSTCIVCQTGLWFCC
jgi:hypothetical protein